jgi:hypothetical protein
MAAPLAKESFGNQFKRACVAAGVRSSAHGVRKIAARAQSTLAQRSRNLKRSLVGRRRDRIALHARRGSTAACNREHAQAQRERSGTSMPSPLSQARAAERKTVKSAMFFGKWCGREGSKLF